MAIRIKAGDGELEALCAELQAACSDVSSEADLVVRYSVDDDVLPKQGALATSPGFFRRSSATLILVRAEFDHMLPDEQLAIALHEIGHACQPDGMPMSDAEFDADLFVCERGHLEALAANRRRWYGRKGAAHGERYAAALAKWRDREDALKAMRHWYMLYLALS